MVYKLSLTSPPTLEVNVTTNGIDGDLARKGARLYSDNCLSCHGFLPTEIKSGPGMKGILKNPTLSSSNKPATPESIIDQLTKPYKMMPSFKDKLSQDQMKAIIEYLKTL